MPSAPQAVPLLDQSDKHIKEDIIIAASKGPKGQAPGCTLGLWLRLEGFQPGSQGVNRYPTPRIDRKYRGLRGSGSKCLRKATMKLSTVRVVGNTL